MADISKLLRWETPISDCPFPSIVSIVRVDSLQIAVAAATDKFEFSFPVCMAFRCTDESIPWHGPESKVGTTAILDGSPWLDSYFNDQEVIRMTYGGPCRHFVILGGDWNVEILAANDPSIKRIS